MNNKVKNQPLLLTHEERKEEVKKIINKLNELELTVSYPPIKKLFIILKKFSDEGGIYKVNIPFEIINKRIKGVLSDYKSEQCVIALKHEKF
tara:strand:+ start:363 stop:638 length:276 start_codon:yes stop_codon:yes gene_type:complete